MKAREQENRPLVSHNGTTYYYITNIQGDVIGIANQSGQLVVQYLYNAWGVHLETTGTMAATLGQLNPLRYRGYVYDTETELYYLQSRYYDPELGRFINADAFVSTGQGLLGNNMFAYCLNNPVLFSDANGFDAIVLYDQDTLGHIGVMVQDSDGKWWHFYWGTAGGKEGIPDRILCFFFVSVRSYTWCVEYKGRSIKINDINAANQYSGQYEEAHYLKGDFSECVDMLKNPQGDYNLYTQNCSQVSLGILASADSDYKEMLQKASTFMLPAISNQYIARQTGANRAVSSVSFSRGNLQLMLK